jgi:glycolate oxidase
VENEGTITGEHGVGLSKSQFLPLVFDQSTLDLMSSIKKAIDPKGILNPGKFI